MLEFHRFFFFSVSSPKGISMGSGPIRSRCCSCLAIPTNARRASLQHFQWVEDVGGFWWVWIWMQWVCGCGCACAGCSSS